MGFSTSYPLFASRLAIATVSMSRSADRSRYRIQSHFFHRVAAFWDLPPISSFKAGKYITMAVLESQRTLDVLD
jgi:hypothetical protein